MERLMCLVNEYPTFYVPRTTLGTRQCGSVKRLCFESQGKCLFGICLRRQTVQKDGCVSLDINQITRYSPCFHLTCVKVQSMYSETCYILHSVVVCLFTVEKPVSLVCLL